MDFVLGFRHFEKCGPIDFWEFLLFSGFGRPFHRERIAVHLGWIAIAFERPRDYGFAAFVFDAAQRLDISCGLHSSFFLELPFRGVQWIFVGVKFALGDEPRSDIFFRPVWSPGMN